MGLRENMLHEMVSELALRDAINVSPATTIREAIEKMKAKRLGCVMVTDEDQVPMGIFTERQVMNLLTESTAFLDAPIRDHLASDWATVKLSDPIAGVLEVMTTKRLRFVCVVDDQGRSVALTGQNGLMEYITDHFPQHVLTQSPGAKMPDDREGA